MPLITCPSGLAGEVRALKVKEADALASAAAAKQGTSFEAVFANCWLRTSEKGIYQLDASGRLDWGSVLLCDRFYALLRIRAATFGEAYDFDVTSCANCERLFEWSLRLADLPVKALPESTLAQLRTQNEFTAVLVDGRTVRFHLQTGAGEISSSQAMHRQPTARITASLLGRIDAIDAVDKPFLRGAIQDLDMGEAISLIEQFDAVDGGVETAINVNCKHCGADQVIELPLGKSFWVPRTQKLTAK